ncbi:unnamed protein product [Bemisia tabaci]|uniref:Uncharacterized protein n=1 Tax=Bemisia tabaci TaxID=7038 RepID=A0A9P0F4S7_BEMTA|nr:unnamed protein product [Bemisia tabaci]
MAAQSPVFKNSQSFENVVLPTPKKRRTSVPSKKKPESYDSFKEVQLPVPEFPTRVSGADLKSVKRYQLKKMEKRETKFGIQLMAWFQRKGKDCFIYLPKEYAKLSDEYIAKINKKPHDLICIGPYFKSYKFAVKPRE